MPSCTALHVQSWFSTDQLSVYEVTRADVRLQMPGLWKGIFGRPHVEGARIRKSHVPDVPKSTNAAAVYLFHRPYDEEELRLACNVVSARTHQSHADPLYLQPPLLGRVHGSIMSRQPFCEFTSRERMRTAGFVG